MRDKNKLILDILIAIALALIILCGIMINRRVSHIQHDDVFSVTVPMQPPYSSPHPYNVNDGI